MLISSIKQELAETYSEYLGWINQSVNLATICAVLHPDKKKNDFLPKEVVDGVWAVLKEDHLRDLKWDGKDLKLKSLIEAEIEYCQSQLLNVDEKDENIHDPLKFYKNWPNTFRMEKIIRRYFCIPATSTPSERAFSDAGIVRSQFRPNLSPETAEKLIFIRENWEFI